MNIDLKELKTNSKLQKILIMILLSAIIGFLCFKNISSLSGLKDSINQNQLEADTMQAKVTYLIALSEKEDEMLAKTKQMETLLPEGINQKQLLSTIGTLCAQYGVEVSQVNFEASVAFSDFSAMPVSLAINGEYDKTMAMLDSLCSDYSLITLSSFSTQMASGGKINTNAVVSVYYR